MSIFERIGVISAIIFALAFLSTSAYVQYDYWTSVRPTITYLNEVKGQGKDAQGKTIDVRRIDFYDIVTQQVLTQKETK